MGIYVTTNLHFRIIKQNWLEYEDCEDLWINVSDRHSNCNCNVIALYRHPNTNATMFFSKLEDALSDPVLINKRIYIQGDFNIDITACNQSFIAQNYINLLSSKGYFPIVTKPTRVTGTSSTIIDHIITNDMSHRLSPMIVKTDVSDHYIVAAVVFNDTFRHKIKSTKIFQRDLTNFSSELFISDIEQFVDQYLGDLPEITKSNFNHLFNHFTDTFKRIIDKHAPFSAISRKNKKLRNKPWITKGLLISIRNKQKMYQTHFLNGNAVSKKMYKDYANKLTKIKATAEKLYYGQEFQNCKSDACKTWSLIKTSLPNKSTKHLPTMLKINNNIEQDLQLVAEKFGEHFSTIASKTLENYNFPTNTNAYKEFLTTPTPNSIFLKPTEPIEVINTISSLKPNRSCGADNIPAKFLQLSATLISEPLSIFVNSAFTLGLFPDNLKTAKVVPVHKTGDKCNPSNYRPISLLTTFSKVFEKLMYSRAEAFLNKHSLIAPTQHGFRAGHSTIHALTDVITSIYDNINTNQHTGLIFLDIKKAFDTVNHKILIQKLEHYGIRGTTTDFFKSYLSDRKQFVILDHTIHSKIYPINSGVPQGSNLGALLFLLYINDLINCSSVTPSSFADDTCLTFNDDAPDKLIKSINDELNRVSVWMAANKLCINTQKSSALLIPPKSNAQINHQSIFLMAH